MKADLSTVFGLGLLAVFAACGLYCAWYWFRAITRWRFATYNRKTDVLRVTLRMTGGPPDPAGTGISILHSETVSAPVKIIHGSGVWRIEIPDISKLGDRERIKPQP